MSNLMLRTFWILALFATGVIAGCSGQTSPPPNPTVVSTSPGNHANNVPLAQVVSVTFDKAMNHSTITATTFTLQAPGGIAVPGTVTSAGTTSTFTPTLPLALGTLYTATITTGVQDTAAHPLFANYIWTFTTGTVPTVASTNPASGATVVPLNQKIAVTFNQPMNPATITAAGAFTLEVTAGAVPVAGTVTYVAGANTALFTPTVSLAPSTPYTAAIAPTVQSVSGNLIAGSHVWSFTTGIIANTTLPTVVSTVPTSAATLVPTNTILTATFSKPMDPTALTAAGTFTLDVAGVGGAAVPGTVSYAGNTVTLMPTSPLTAATQYTATITTAAQDLTGNALAANYVWSFTSGAGPSTTAPTITLTNPASASSTAPLNGAVNATFSEDMNPATVIAPGTFTLNVAGVGGASVPGSVTYDVNSDIATFTPNANLTATTQYTATISTGATDVSGNPLDAGLIPNPWTFTTGSTTEQMPPNLGTAATFGAFGGGAGITNQGIHTIINGDIGTTGASTLVTGFHDSGVGCNYTVTGSNLGLVNGNIDTAPPPPTGACLEEGTATTFDIATQAAADANTAYLDLDPASRPGGTDPGSGQLGGLTMPPGVYKAAGGTFLITGSDLTLDAQGDTNAVWVFQTASSLTVGGPGAPRNVILINGAQAKNVFWQVGSAATINAAGGGTMVGTIIASMGVTFSTPGNAAICTLNGRAIGLNASVTMVNTVVNVPAP
jgi:Ice-binding-like/Bacterial Ig-like domain